MHSAGRLRSHPQLATKLPHSHSCDLLHTHQRHGTRARPSHTHTVRRLLRPGRGRGGLGLSANLDSLGCLGLWDSSDDDSKGELEKGVNTVTTHRRPKTATGRRWLLNPPPWGSNKCYSQALGRAGGVGGVRLTETHTQWGCNMRELFLCAPVQTNAPEQNAHLHTHTPLLP